MIGDENKKILAVCLFFVALALIGVIAFDIAGDVFETPVVNNTDIGYPLGTNERLYNVTYWANNSDIDLYLIAHFVGTGGPEDISFNLSINGTAVEATDRARTISNNVHEHFPMHARIPKGANYTVRNNTMLFQMEWREYPVLKGRNGSVRVEQNILGNSFNTTYDLTTREFNSNFSVHTFPNDSIITNNNTLTLTKVNKTGDTISGNINMNNNTLTLGNITINSSVKIHAFNSTSPTLTHAIVTKIIFDTVDFDTQGNYNKTSGNFTVTKSGYYVVSSMVGVTLLTSNGVQTTYIAVNGPLIRQSVSNYLSSTNGGDSNAGYITALLFLNVNDTVEIKTRVSPQNNENTEKLSGLSTTTWLDIHSIN